MCGIAGFVLRTPIDDARAILARMTRSLVARGPDSEGYWFDNESQIGFGHRRLAIVDLSETGRQPMHSSSGRYTITFNGEIYNFRELRQQLQKLGVGFRGTSDTEVMLAAFEMWGPRYAIERFVGMFAFGLWDRRMRRLYLVRDRLGKKPIYVAWVRGSLVFASEPKALRLFPDFDAQIDRDALALFMRHNYVPTPYSIYKSVQKLPAGTIATFDFAADKPQVVQERYWSAMQVAANGKATPFHGTYADAVAAFKTQLESAVRMRMIADVPLGAFLSGGIDSSLVVGLMTQFSGRPVKTFTIGFNENAYDEARHAKAIATHFGTEHVEHYVTPREALDVIPELPRIYCEPFADSSQIPTCLVSKVTRQSVTVALSGDGGDELCCGYNRYLWMKTVWSAIRTLPRPIRKAIGALLAHGGATSISAVMRMIGPIVPPPLRAGQLRDRLIKFSDVLMADDARTIYRQLISHWTNPEDVVLGASRQLPDLADEVDGNTVEEVIESLMNVDTATYLADDILVKVDRATMAYSLEARAPLLDHRLFELVRTMPLHFQLQGSRGKLLLRSVLRDLVPEVLTERPKTGFGVPIDTWLCGPLRDWAESLLDARKLETDGFFDVNSVRRVWEQHLDGQRRNHYLIWDVLMFQSWYEDQKTAPLASRKNSASG